MKSKLIFSSLVLYSLLFLSCKKEEEEDPTTSSAPKEIILPIVQAIPSEPYMQNNNQNVAPVQSQTITPTTQAVTQTPVTTKPGMNPPHGQPGHRCDISVGESLNSPVATPASKASGTVQPATITSSPTTMTTPATTIASPATPAILSPNSGTTVTAPGMNPPHGEAGHVCGTAVGAPLPK